jgi:Asp-tRNA(Asn)/Glu-tRNA(Gln) amidotransferase A subunit family amidase
VDCTPFIQDWLTPNPQTTNLTNCVGQKFDAVLFPANFGANPPARAGYPSVTVPAGRFSFTTVFDNGFVPRQSPIGVTFTGPRFSEPKLIGLAYSFEQTPITTPATSDATPEHREPPPDPNLN